MSKEGNNIVYGASAALALLTAGALDAHIRGMQAVRAAREENAVDQLHAHYAAELATQAEQLALKDTQIAMLREQIAEQRKLAAVASELFNKLSAENKDLKAAVDRKSDLLNKMLEAVQNLQKS